MQARALLKSLALHGLIVSVALMLPAGPLRRSAQPDEVEVVFHPPPPVEIPAPVIPHLPGERAIPAGPRTAHAVPPAFPAAPSAPVSPLAASTPGFPEGTPEAPAAESPQRKVGKSGILAFRDQIASVAEEQKSVRLGDTAHLSAAAEASATSPSAYLLNAVPDGSGGINAASLTRDLG